MVWPVRFASFREKVTDKEMILNLTGQSVKASGLEKSSNLSEIKKNTCQSQHVPFFPQTI